MKESNLDAMPLNEEGETTVSRRHFLARAMAVGVAVSGASTLLVACTPKKADSGGDKGGGDKGGAKAACNDISGLSDAEKTARETQIKNLKYVEKSTDPAKNCANCQLYQAPAGGKPCGGCALFKGPVEANGYCASWAKKS